jgi:hypothetical protein
MAQISLETIEKRAAELFDLGEKIKSTEHFEISTTDYSAWKTGSLNLIRLIAGESSATYKDFDGEIERIHNMKYQVDYGRGVISSLVTDLSYGLLGEIKNLAFAEVFTDFLEMAKHLLDQEYKDPAALLTGATLEEGLRKLASKNSITVSSSDVMASLAQKLVQGKVIDEIKRKQIMAWNEIRDKAAHGQFDQYSKEQVDLMITGIRDFLVNHS